MGGNFVEQLLLTTQLVTALFMTGLIWFVQVVHYPLMKQVPAGVFTRYERTHQARTSWVVAPPMLLELVTAIGLATVAGGELPAGLLGLNLALVGLVWGSTLFLQMPLHRRLAQGHDAALIHRLVLSNWLRTGLWSARSALMLWLAWAWAG